MTVLLTVRATDGLFSWNFDEWQCLVAIAAVSAEPESLAEYFAAVRRFQPEHEWVRLATSVDSIDQAASTDEQWCLVDLVSRSILGSADFELPERRTVLQADDDDGPVAGSPVVWLNTPPDWLLEVADDNWATTVALRSEVYSGQVPIDSRPILYGRTMQQFLADRLLVAAAQGVTEDEQFETGRKIHADWLMTERDDLGGQSPRSLLLQHHEYLSWEMQYRSHQWSMQGFAVPPLKTSSSAYRFAGFGTIEVVTYFDLMRSLLAEAWKQIDAGVMDSDELTNHLAEHQRNFLDNQPEDGSAGLTCAELIESERRRMPVTADKSHLDCDCPICQASLDGSLGSGPMFMSYDGHHLELEEEFAFSMIESLEAWQKQQDDERRMTQEFRQKEEERKALNEERDSVWQSNFVDWDKLVGGGQSPISPQMALGFPLAELISHLKTLNADQTHTDSLNLAFTAFRSASNQTEVEIAGGEFRTCLENAASEFPEVIPQSADLQSRMDEVLRLLKQQTAVAEQGGAAFEPALLSTPPILNVVVFQTPGPSDEDIDKTSSDHTRNVSARPLGGGLGYLTLQPDDFERVAEGIAAEDTVGTAAAVLHFMGPKAADLIQQPQDLDYCWTITDETEFGRVLLLQVVMRPHLLE